MGGGEKEEVLHAHSVGKPSRPSAQSEVSLDCSSLENPLDTSGQIEQGVLFKAHPSEAYLTSEFAIEVSILERCPHLKHMFSWRFHCLDFSLEETLCLCCISFGFIIFFSPQLCFN